MMHEVNGYRVKIEAVEASLISVNIFDILFYLENSE